MRTTTVAVVALAICLTGKLTLYAFHEAGDHSEDAVTIKFSECPQAVQKTLVREARGTKIETVELGTVDLQVAFTAHATIDGQTYLIHVTASGALVSKTLDEDDDKAEEVALTACPPAVQKTLTREADGVAIKKVSKSTSEGRTLYQASVKIEGQLFDLSVTAEGLLLAKEGNEDLSAEGLN